MAVQFLAKPLISAVAGFFGDRNKKKREKAQALHERELAHIKSDTDYNYAAVSNESWKDGYLTVILTLPFLSYFYGSMVGSDEVMERVDGFFVAMSGAPDWYQYAFLGMIVACYGLKGWSMHEALKRK